MEQFILMLMQFLATFWDAIMKAASEAAYYAAWAAIIWVAGYAMKFIKLGYSWLRKYIREKFGDNVDKTLDMFIKYAAIKYSPEELAETAYEKINKGITTRITKGQSIVYDLVVKKDSSLIGELGGKDAALARIETKYKDMKPALIEQGLLKPKAE